LLEKKISLESTTDDALIIQTKSLIHDQNWLDVLEILHETCTTIQKESCLNILLNNELPKDLKSYMLTIIYAVPIVQKELGPVPELLLLERLFRCYLLSFDKKGRFNLWKLLFLRSKIDKKQLHPTTADTPKVHAQVTSKLSSSPSSKLINEYLNVFREDKKERNHQVKAIDDNKVAGNDSKHNNTLEKTRNEVGSKKPNVVSHRLNLSEYNNNNKNSKIQPEMLDTDYNADLNGIKILNTFSVDSTCSNDDDHPLSVLSPILPIHIFRPNPHLEIAFDIRSKNPLYVLEHLKGRNHNNTEGREERRPSFFEEESLPPEYRSRLQHYLHSGYDRGHLAPAADFVGKERKDTFTLCNVSPQVHSMNISIWSKLERWCRRVAATAAVEQGQQTFVITGPLWLPFSRENTFQIQNSCSGHLIPNRGLLSSYNYQYHGLQGADSNNKSLVQVPTHFFKFLVVVNLALGTIQKYQCFLIPNVEMQKGMTLIEFTISWKELEILSGLQFFSSLPHPSIDAEIFDSSCF